MSNRNQYFLRDFLTSDGKKHLLLAAPRKHIKMRLEAWQKECDEDGHLRADEYPDPQWVVDELLAEYPATKATGETSPHLQNIAYASMRRSRMLSPFLRPLRQIPLRLWSTASRSWPKNR